MSFLNDDNLKRVWYPFYPRATWVRTGDRLKPNLSKKNIIPIGVHELEIKHVKDVKTKKGNRKVELYIYKQPDYFLDTDAEKCSFDYIVCSHVKSFRPQGNIKVEWYHRLTMCLGDKDLDTMIGWKGKKFKAVVLHAQEYVDDYGKVKINEFGEEVVYWQPRILSVHRIEDDIQVKDWFALFRPIRYDPIEETKGLKYAKLFEKNTSNITGGDKEDIIPF